MLMQLVETSKQRRKRQAKQAHHATAAQLKGISSLEERHQVAACCQLCLILRLTRAASAGLSV